MGMAGMARPAAELAGVEDCWISVPLMTVLKRLTAPGIPPLASPALALDAPIPAPAPDEVVAVLVMVVGVDMVIMVMVELEAPVDEEEAIPAIPLDEMLN